MTNVNPWMYALSPPHICYPIRYRAFPILTSQSSANFAGASKPRDMILFVAHKPPYIFLKTATTPTYHGISIAIPRYIAMKLPPFRFYDTHRHCHIALHDHIADIVFVAQPTFIIIYTCYASIIAHPGTLPEAFI